MAPEQEQEQAMERVDGGRRRLYIGGDVEARGYGCFCKVSHVGWGMPKRSGITEKVRIFMEVY